MGCEVEWKVRVRVRVLTIKRCEFALGKSVTEYLRKTLRVRDGSQANRAAGRYVGGGMG